MEGRKCPNDPRIMRLKMDQMYTWQERGQTAKAGDASIAVLKWAQEGIRRGDKQGLIAMLRVREMYLMQRRFEEAEFIPAETIKSHKQDFEADDRVMWWENDLYFRICERQNRLQEDEKIGESVLRWWQQEVGEHLNTARTMHLMGLVYARQGRRVKAFATLEKALGMSATTAGKLHPSIVAMQKHWDDFSM